MTRSVAVPDFTQVPALGQGTWRMGENPRRRADEIASLRIGVELGLSLIDTAEMYGDGATESLLGEALKGQRDQVFLVSKVYPQNSGRGRIERACEASLKRLKTDRLDLYLLHWRGAVPLAETVEGTESLVSSGKIRRWGVSNVDSGDMEELFRAGGEACATNQVLYNVTERGVEFDLLLLLKARRIPTMAYSPLGQGELPASKALASIGRRLGQPRSRSPWPGCYATQPSSPSQRLVIWRTSRRIAERSICNSRRMIWPRSTRTSTRRPESRV